MSTQRRIAVFLLASILATAFDSKGVSIKRNALDHAVLLSYEEDGDLLFVTPIIRS
jgi:hypothetical protein